MAGPNSEKNHSRRSVLCGVGGIVTAGLLPGTLTSRTITSASEHRHDGIPTHLIGSQSFDRYLENTFDVSLYNGLSHNEKNLLLDVRLVGDVSISMDVKRYLVNVFAAHGIHLHWLEYLHRYDEDQFYTQFGPNSRSILWSSDSFYRNVVEDRLKNIALQVVVINGIRSGAHEGMIYSHWADVLSQRGGYINGMNFGNRIVVANRNDEWEQTRLLFHEIAHLALCHDSNDTNTGVMGTNEALALTQTEWSQLRRNLSNVNDRTGSDVVFRKCLWTDDFGGVG